MAKSYSMRRAAFQAVRGWSEKGWRIETSISRIRESQGLAVRDVAAAKDIAAMTIKRVASLDVVIRAYCSRPRENVESELWTLAQIGLSQLLFRRDIPPHAAVHETVALADELGKPQWKGFLNGLLRAIARSVKFQSEISFVDGLQAVATQATTGDLWAIFDRPLVDGGPADSEWLSRVYSLPRWCTRRWLNVELPETVSLDVFLRGCNSSSQQWVRANLMRQPREELMAKLRASLDSDVTVEAGPVAEAISLTGPVTLSSLDGFADGSCSVQDLTPMQVVEQLNPQPDERILDLCAAPGGKTGHLAERLAGTGHVVAADISESRLRRVKENVDRLKLTNVSIEVVNREGGLVRGGKLSDGGFFDAAIVDVPCSNTGVLAKRPEARWRISESDLQELPQLQQTILRGGAASIRPGGRLVYSTCSVEPEENREVVDAFLNDNPHWTLVEENLYYPIGVSDGGYHALLRSNAQ